MTEADIAFAVEMTDIEKWGYLQDDFRRLIYFEPGGCFVAWKGDRRVGMITTTSYDDYAFLGCLIVPEDQRGRGIGESLMKHAVNYLQNRGAKTIELDGVFAAAPLYRRLGFQDKYLSLRFKRNAGKEAGGFPARPPISGEEIIAFDRKMIRLSRERIIRKYLEQMSGSIHVLEENGIHAFAIARPRAGGLVTFGPMIADYIESAERLLVDLINGYGSGSIAVGVPEINRGAVNLLTDLGFQYGPPSLRMYLGRRRDYEENVYGIFSAEKG